MCCDSLVLVYEDVVVSQSPEGLMHSYGASHKSFADVTPPLPFLVGELKVIG